MIPAVREMAQRYPAIRAWRLALVSFLADAGRLEETRTEFERLAAHDFDDIPLDAQWLTAMTRIADACAHLGDAQRAAPVRSSPPLPTTRWWRGAQRQ